MEFRILGTLEVASEGRLLPLGGAKQRAMLAILLLSANEVVSTDRLIDTLWGGRPPQAAAAGVQNFASQLRKVLEPEAGRGQHRILVTRPPGYVLRVQGDRLDLTRFERLLAEARKEAAPEAKASKLRAALSLWRGAPLADLGHAPFAQPEIHRLEELRLVALEERIDAELAIGRHADAVADLEPLIAEHPLRERLRAQLMVALYRAGRQAEALRAYQDARRALVDELGLEPSPSLRALEKQVLAQDPALAWYPPEEQPAAGHTGRERPRRSILVALSNESGLDRLLALAAPLAGPRASHELILARLVPPREAEELRRTSARLDERRAELGAREVSARVAAFTSAYAGSDLARLASEQDVDLVLLDAEADRILVPATRTVLDQAPCDVALVLPPTSLTESLERGAAIVVPFGGAEHDWAALELGAWLASAHDARLTLLGTTERPAGGKRDASRLLATASLAIQRVVGIAAEPLLTPAGHDAVAGVAESALAIVLGISRRWRSEGLGSTRLAIAGAARAPTLVVRRGPRPGVLAPGGSLTQYTWSLAG